MHIQDVSFALYHLTLAVAVFIFQGELYVNTCSVELLARGVHAMNNVVLTKWRIAQSITSKCLRITEEWFECYDHDNIMIYIVVICAISFRVSIV